MAAEDSVEKHECPGVDSRTSEHTTEIAEQSMVRLMAEVPSDQQVIASVSGNVPFDVNDTKGKDLVSELAYQKRTVKNTEGQSSNGLPKGYTPLSKSLSGRTEVTDKPRVTKRSYFSSAGHHVHIISDGIETEHFYPWDSKTGQYRRCRCSFHSAKAIGISSMNRNGTSASHNFSVNSRPRPNQVTSSFRKPTLISERSSSPRSNHQYNNLPNGRRNNYVFSPLLIYKDNIDSDVSKEIVCGPRALGGDSIKKNEMEVEDELPYFAQRKNFNLPDFRTEYENAKFYVIKSFGEDNVHKSIKYGVWSSTPHGNGKLEAAYHEAKAKSIETCAKCPIFLFFSVNRSGQFVGVAEMIGRVDFSKDLDFWQLDKWSGFFPVKWHILKDIPHSALWHIILKENDNRSVTYTRDTQEIGLCQGIEMLKIFKNHPAKISLLDDFFFYENREKLRAAERKSKAAKQKSEEYIPEYDHYRDEDDAYYYNPGHGHDDITSVTSRTGNLSLNPRSP